MEEPRPRRPAVEVTDEEVVVVVEESVEVVVVEELRSSCLLPKEPLENREESPDVNGTSHGRQRRHREKHGEERSSAELESERTAECVRAAGARGEAGVPAVNAVRLVVGGGRLPGFSVTGVRVQAGSG